LQSGTFYPAVGADDGDWNVDPGGFTSAEADLIWGGSVESWRGYVRFPNTIPAGATIEGCYVRLTCKITDARPFDDGILYFNDIDAAVAPTDETEGAALDLTTESVVWDPGAVVDGSQYNSPSLVDALQEVIDRPGRNSSDAVMLIMYPAEVLLIVPIWASIDFDAGNEKAELHVTWREW